MYTYITTENELINCRDTLLDYIGKVKNPKLALDLETFSTVEGEFPTPISDGKGGLIGQVSLMQIGADPTIYDQQWLIDVRKVGPNLITKYLKDILTDTLLLGHHIKYDVGFLMVVFDIFPTKLRDTMLISQVYKAGDKFKHNLANLYKKFLDYGWFKAETGRTFTEYESFKEELQKSNWEGPLTSDQLQYAADDVRLIFFLYKALMDELDKFVAMTGRKGIYNIIKLECNLISEFTLMEIRGIDIDVDRHMNYVVPYLEAKKEEASKIAREAFPTIGKKYTRGRGVNKREIQDPLNTNSAPQIIAALRSLGLNPISSEEAEIKSLREDFEVDSSEYAALTAILDAKKSSSLSSKFGENFIKEHVKPDGRIHPSMHQIGNIDNGVSTGRSSSSNPNIMQIPAREKLFKDVKAKQFFRRSFICPPGFILGDVDLSQIEPRVTAQVTKDLELVREFRKEDADLHALTAQSLLGLLTPPERGSYERDYIGKTANLAMSYGIGPKKLAKFMFDKTVGGDQPPVRWKVSECKEYMERYYDKFEGIREEMQRSEESIKKALTSIPSLVAFKNRKPIHIAFTILGRPRRWCLSSVQEEMARTCPEKLHRDYVERTKFPVLNEYGEPIRDLNGKIVYEYRESKWGNQYWRTINRIAREAYNHVIQGSSADLLKLATLESGKKINLLTGDVLNQGIIAVVHDEILFRVREDLGQQCLDIVINEMIEQGKKIVKVVPIKAEGGLSTNWADCKD